MKFDCCYEGWQFERMQIKGSSGGPVVIVSLMSNYRCVTAIWSSLISTIPPLVVTFVRIGGDRVSWGSSWRMKVFDVIKIFRAGFLGKIFRELFSWYTKWLYCGLKWCLNARWLGGWRLTRRGGRQKLQVFRWDDPWVWAVRASCSIVVEYLSELCDFPGNVVTYYGKQRNKVKNEIRLSK